MRAAIPICFLLALSAAPSAQADNPTLRRPPPLAKDVDSLPRPAGASEAEARIAHALDAVERNTRTALADCRQQGGKDANWSRRVWVTMQGPHYFSLLISDDADCGGAHPSEGLTALTYDLSNGRPVNWQRLLPRSLVAKAQLDTAMDGTRIGEVAGPALTSLYLAHINPDADCREALGTDELWFQLWPDAKADALAQQPANLPHVVQACGDTAEIKTDELRRLGADPALVSAIEAAHDSGAYDKSAP